MSQQINLFNPVLSRRRRDFSTRTMLQALLLIGIGGLCLLVFLNQRVAALTQLAESGKQQLAAREAKLVTVLLQFTPRPKNGDLAQEIAATSAQLKALQDAKAVLQRVEFGNVGGYSAYFRALARQTVSGLWLTGVTISGSDIGIEGRTLSAELVPRYIRRLASEPVFQGKTFASLDIMPAAGAAMAADKLLKPISPDAVLKSANPDTLPGNPDAPAVLVFKLQAAGVQEAPGSAAK